MFMRAFTLAASNPPPKITEWISAISAATLGLLALTFTIWQWRGNGFRPRLSARVDGKGEAIELTIVNRGRAAGLVEEITLLKPEGEFMVFDEDIKFEGFTGGQFTPVLLPGLASMRLIIEASAGHNFSDQTELRVWIGDEKNKYVPLPADSKVGLFGLKSVLPPGTRT